VISGARQARPNFFRRLVAWAQARELAAFVVSGPEAARAIGVDLEAAGLRASHTPRHASVLVLVGELPPGLKRATAVAYAQMPRPRAILAVGVGDVSLLPKPDVAVGPGQEDVAAGAAELRRLFARSAFSPEASDFDVDAIRTQTEYVCPMHPEVVRSEPGSCPICGMDLVPRGAAGVNNLGAADDAGDGTHHGSMDHGSHEQHDAQDEDHGSHGDTGHGEGEHPTAAHDDREEGWDEGREVADHGHSEHDGHGQGGVSHGEHDHAEHQHTDEGDADAHPDGHGDSEHGAHGEHEGHEHTDHGGHDHGGHEHMDHGDMGFMSMVEMTENLPRSSDGLQMEWVEDVPFGPLFPGLPGGLTLTVTLDGDTVAGAEAEGIEGRASAKDLGGLAETLADRLARLDPLSPIAYRVLALRALESAAGVEPDERMVFARVGALEKERAASHLGWLSLFGRLIGYQWLEDRAGSFQLALVRAASIDEVARLWVEAGRLSRRVEKTPLLRRKLRGVGLLPEEAEPLGPVARAAGVGRDARADEEIYQSLGFESVIREGDDALSRLRVRLTEIEQSLDLVQKAGEMTIPERTLNGVPLREGSATVETPRGAATLHLTPERGALKDLELDEPSARHLGLVGVVAEQQELADVLVGVASLDLSPWGVAR